MSQVGIRRRWLAGALGLVVLAMGLVGWPYLSLLGPQKFRNYVYREVTYAQIVRRTLQREPGRLVPQERAIRLARYVHNQMFSGLAFPGTSSFALDNLVSGMAVCYDQALALVALAHYAGLDGRTRYLLAEDRSVTHTVAELRFDGHWRYFDPYLGVVVTKTSTGEVATIESLADGDASSSKLQAFGNYMPKAVSDYLTYIPLDTWGPFSIALGWPRRILTGLVRVSVWSAGPALAGYQDWYFRKGWKPDLRSADFFGSATLDDPRFLELYTARNLHLWGRLEKARALYQQLINEGSPWTEHASYFLAHSYREAQRLNEAIEWFERLLTTQPNTFWKDPATYWLAWCYEQQGDVERARALYEPLVLAMGLDASLRLRNLTRSQ